MTGADDGRVAGHHREHQARQRHAVFSGLIFHEAELSFIGIPLTCVDRPVGAM